MYGYEVNWIKNDRNSKTWAFNYDIYLHLVQYLRSIYWALYSASSIGYWDIIGTNPVEILVITLILLYGCQMLNAVIGGISSLIQTLDANRKEYEKKMRIMEKLLEMKHLDRDTKEKIFYYYEYNWTRNKGVNEHQVKRSIKIEIINHE